MAAWVFLRAQSFEGALSIFKGMISLPSDLATDLGVFNDVLLGLGFQFSGTRLFTNDVQVLPWLFVFRSGFVAQIVAQAVSLVVLGYAKED
ncbi:MAG TPA: hypothetical protein VHJ19_08250 [Gammaproteobacteria bacterium]|nr:hypothetical protein [Gammaproteobacteria bacterium]